MKQLRRDENNQAAESSAS